MHIQHEQKKLFDPFVSSYDFIKQYFYVYDLQKNHPYKIFIDDISYPIDTYMFQEIFNHIDKNKINSFDFLQQFDILLQQILKYEFYDKSFFEIIKTNYIKSIIYFLDSLDNENDIYKLFDVYNYYFNINFYDIIFSRLNFNFKNKNGFYDQLMFVKKFFEKIIEKNEVSFVKSEINKRMKADERVFNYNFVEFIDMLNDKLFAEYFLILNNEDAYLQWMNYTSELVTRRVINEERVISRMKTMSIELLNKI